MYGIPSARSRTLQPVEEKEFAPGLRVMAPAREAQARRQIENEALANVAQGTVQRSADQAVAGALQTGANRNAQPVAASGRGLPAKPQGQPATSQPQPTGGAGVPGYKKAAGSAADVAAGVAKTTIGALAYPQLAAYDAVRNAAGELADGDTSQIKQTRDASTQLMSSGVDQASAGAEQLGEQVKGGVRGALGIEKAQPPVAAQPTGRGIPSRVKSDKPAAPADTGAESGVPAEPTAAGIPATASAEGEGWQRTGIGQGAAGGEIVGRRGADGVPEFTNDAKAVAGAQAMPSGGFGLPGRAPGAPADAAPTAANSMSAPDGARVLASGTSVQAGDTELARTGSAANVGNGKGTFSVMGEAGDAKRAIATFERANQIRGGIPQRREIGDNGGRVTVVRDSSRAPTIAEIINERRDMQQREADRADRLADSRIATDGRNTSLAEQRQALDMAKGDVELAAAESALATSQELDAIRQRLADPSLGEEERKALVDTYYAMTTPAKDRYMEVKGGENEAGAQQASRVLDRRTGQYVDSGGTGIANDPEAAAIRDNPKLSREEKVAQLKALGYN